MLTIDGDTMYYQSGSTLFVWKGGMYIDIHFAGEEAPRDLINIADMEGNYRVKDPVGFVLECENYLSEGE